MKILFVHQNFPGQYKHLIAHLAASAENEIVFISQRKQSDIPGVKHIVYQPRVGKGKETHHYLRDTEAFVRNGQAVAEIAIRLKQHGFVPDVMVGHNGWGEIWYLKDIFPKSPLLGYFEFFYRSHGADVGFDPAFKTSVDTAPRIRTKNIGNLLGLDAADLGQTPTLWQKSGYPSRYHSMLEVVHEGIDTDLLRPSQNARIEIPAKKLVFSPGDEIVTYVARNLEPYRGFPTFMRSLPTILSRRENAHVLIVGADETSYGAPLPDGQTYRQKMIDELGSALDMERVHFLGRVPYRAFMNLIQVSRVHVYLTYPFVLSWSMLEAMSAGCLIVGSRTAPVEEVIRDRENGVLADFFSPDEIAERVIDALANPSAYSAIKENARRTIVEKYDLRTICLPAQLRLLSMAREM